MCDCYWQKCKCCETHLPVHISDFCMEREGISVFCASHLPGNDIVIYELIDDKKISEKWEPEEHFDRTFSRKNCPGSIENTGFKRSPSQ